VTEIDNVLRDVPCGSDFAIALNGPMTALRKTGGAMQASAPLLAVGTARKKALTTGKQGGWAGGGWAGGASCLDPGYVRKFKKWRYCKKSKKWPGHDWHNHENYDKDCMANKLLISRCMNMRGHKKKKCCDINKKNPKKGFWCKDGKNGRWYSETTNLIGCMGGGTEIRPGRSGGLASTRGQTRLALLTKGSKAQSRNHWAYKGNTTITYWWKPRDPKMPCSAPTGTLQYSRSEED